MNKAILIGRVGADPELKNLDAGNKVVNFSLATSERYKDKAGVKQEKTEWHNIVAWGSLAENIAKFVKKGTQLSVEGKIQNRSYEDKEGVKKYTSEVVANEIEFLSPKKSEEGDGSAQATTTSAPAKTATGKKDAKAPVTATVTTTSTGDDEDLPF